MTAITSATGQFGKLWSKGHETLLNRRIIAILPKPLKSLKSKSTPMTSATTTFLQGLLTSDLQTSPPSPRPWMTNVDDHFKEESSSSETSSLLRSTCFLDHKGRVLTDALLWKVRAAGISTKFDEYLKSQNHYTNNDLDQLNRDEVIYFIDVAENSVDSLMSHLQSHKLRRSAVQIVDVSDLVGSHTIYGTRYNGPTPSTPSMNLISSVDPRHPSIGLRLLSFGHGQGEASKVEFNNLLADSPFPSMQGSYELIRRLAGIAEGNELLGKTALETNQDWLNAVSFKKGCYLGQELTARSQFTGTIRKRIMPLFLIDRTTQIPWHWVIAKKNVQRDHSDDETSEGIDQNISNSMINSCGLPYLSAPEAGSIMASLLGDSHKPNAEIESQQHAAIINAQRDQDQKFQLLTEQLVEKVRLGHKLVNAENGKVIGEVVAPPVTGTSVILAQIRLEHILPKNAWKEMNQVRIQDADNGVLCDHLRYMPYLPLWWPRDIDDSTGKERRIDTLS